MDLETQEAVQQLAAENDRDERLVLLGQPDVDSAGPFAETVTIGDPSYAGPLAESQLGLDVSHILENEIARAVPEDVYEEQVGLMADVIDVGEVSTAVRSRWESARACGDAPDGTTAAASPAAGVLVGSPATACPRRARGHL